MSEIKDVVIDEIILKQPELEEEDDELIDPSHKEVEVNIDTLEF